MIIALAVFLFFLSIFFHELGHAFYMKKYGVPIRTFSVGLPFPIRIKFVSKKLLPGTVMQFTPFILGAYVEPTKEGAEKIEKLGYKVQADISGGGPIANLIFCFVLLVFHEAFLLDIKGVWMASILSLLLFVGKKIIMRYIMVPTGIALFVLIARIIISEPSTQSVMGPIGIVGMFGGISGINDVLALVSSLSLSLGLFNMIPILPLDGGRIFYAFLQKINAGKFIRILYQFSSVLVFIFLIVFAFRSDIVNILK